MKKNVEETELVKEGQEAEALLAQVKEFQIVSQSDMDFANECLGEVKAKIKALKKTREEATKPMNAALAKIRSWFKPAETFYSMAEDVWKTKMAAFARAQAEAQRKALEAVQEAHAGGDVKEVALAMNRAVAADVVLPSNVSVRKRWGFTVENPGALPEEFLKIVPDLDKIRQAVDSSEGRVEIPGVRVFPDDIVVRR